MNQLSAKSVIVTGGSRGFGRGMVEALAAAGATVHAIARDSGKLDQLQREVPGVQTCAADIRDPALAARVRSEVRPDILILNAGASPSQLPIHEQSWEQFDSTWDTDVRATFEFGKAALLLPLKPGSVVMVVSSGAATAGNTLLTTSYGGAKRMQWFLARAYQETARARTLNIRFVVLVPRISNRTALGQAALAAFVAREGIAEQTFLDRFGVLLTPEMVGQAVVDILTDAVYQDDLAYGFSDKGLLKPLTVT